MDSDLFRITVQLLRVKDTSFVESASLIHPSDNIQFCLAQNSLIVSTSFIVDIYLIGILTYFTRFMNVRIQQD